SSSDLLASQLLAEFARHDVRGEIVRVVDYDVLPGITPDEGDGDQWPRIRERILAADILLVSTPTWLGHMSSVAQRML
ncbi:flavodoxin family protein, partial [Nocardia farcinica]